MRIVDRLICVSDYRLTCGNIGGQKRDCGTKHRRAMWNGAVTYPCSLATPCFIHITIPPWVLYTLLFYVVLILCTTTSSVHVYINVTYVLVFHPYGRLASTHWCLRVRGCLVDWIDISASSIFLVCASSSVYNCSMFIPVILHSQISNSNILKYHKWYYTHCLITHGQQGQNSTTTPRKLFFSKKKYTSLWVRLEPTAPAV